ncbi:hypothetical protein PCH70_32160 [Pseudomonas cichorii JBC1]|nr:hypothetical protein PCH70_32160 [Pseudomonas cichorii JBC1]
MQRHLGNSMQKVGGRMNCIWIAFGRHATKPTNYAIHIK